VSTPVPNANPGTPEAGSPAPESLAAAPRSLGLVAAALLVLAVPFLLFGLLYLDLKALVSLECAPGGPCTLYQAGWLSREAVGTFSLEELLGAHVQRSRSPRGQRDPVFRPMLDTTRGTFPLNYDWLRDEAAVTSMVESLERFRKSPEQGLSLRRDDRHKLVRTGALFTTAGVLVVVLGAWVAARAVRQRRREGARHGHA
jgi:hypothetical protein